jgi:flagellar L-ring protein precursor FlgH
MKYSIKIIVIINILLFNACSSKQNMSINLDEKPKEQVKLQTKEKKKMFKGSLYSQQGTSLFADKKDLQIGDILQVNIEESLKNNSKNSRDLSKTNTTSLGGGILAPLNGVTPTAGVTSRITRLNSSIGIGFNSTSNSTFKGASSSKVDEKFSTIVSVVITQIYQNGNYFIKGTKELLINEQKQKIAISGIIRPYDISPTNTVLSSQIANLKILYKKDGEENDSLNKSWGTRIIETIWPF